MWLVSVCWQDSDLHAINFIFNVSKLESHLISVNIQYKRLEQEYLVHCFHPQEAGLNASLTMPMLGSRSCAPRCLLKSKCLAPSPPQVSAPPPAQPCCFSCPLPLSRLFPLLRIYPSKPSSDVTSFTKPSLFLFCHQQLNIPYSQSLVLLSLKVLSYRGLLEAKVDILFYHCFNTWNSAGQSVCP